LQDYFQNKFLRKVYGMLQGSSEVCPIGPWAPWYSSRFLTNSSQWQSSHHHDLQSIQHAMA
jgi:hypothetical protein